MEKQVIIKDLLVSYHEVAGENNQTLLFLHGWRSNKEAWRGIIERFKDLKIERLGMVAVDLPGFGKSETPKFSKPFGSSSDSSLRTPHDLNRDMGWDVGDYAEVVAGFINKLELKNVTLIGHSFGGRVAIKLAAIQPGLISKLVLVDSAGFVTQESKKSLMAAAAKIVKPLFKPRFMQPLRRRIYRRLGAEDYLATPELRQTFINIVKEDLTKYLEQVRQPALIIWGRNDRETPIRFAERMHVIIPRSSLVILEHAGHFSFIDQPEMFTKVLRKFILS